MSSALECGDLSPLSSLQRPRSRGRKAATSRRTPKLLLTVIVCSWLGAPAAADDPYSAGGAHVNFQAGHLAFETFGRQVSISPIEILPFVRSHDEALFGDVRLFITNTGQLGGNFGLGYRLQSSEWDHVYGASLWYDADDSTGRLFHQAGLSLDVLGEAWEARANGYIPVDDREKEFSRRLFNQRFVGNSILFDVDRRWGEALPGFDLELGLLLPGRLAEEADLRVFAGWYYFLGDRVDNISGFKARVQGDLLAGLSSQVEFTTDDTFGSNVMVGVSWAYDEKFRRRPASIRGRSRLTDFVRRNYNIIVSRQREFLRDVTAVDPNGQPFVVQHVSNSGGGSSTDGDPPDGGSDPTGTVDAPFTTLADARAAGGHFIFVHAGSVLGEPLILESGDRVLGEGPEHLIAVAGFGHVLLPRATPGTNRPLIQSTAGDSVVLASNTVFSGFVIDGSGGNGIVGTGVGNVLVRHVDVRNTAGAGILLEDTAGPVTFRSVQIDNAAGAGLHVTGGNGTITFDGAIHNQTGHALLVENTTGGFLNLATASIHDNGGLGVLFDHADSDVTVRSVLVENGAAAGIDIRGGTGDFSFHDVTVSDAAEAGIHIEGAAGVVAFTTAHVTGANGNPAVNVADSPGSVLFGSLHAASTGGPALEVVDSGFIGVAAGTLSATGDSAAVVRGTTMDVTPTSVFSDGGVYGLEIVDAPGRFIVNGDGALGAGGTIQNASAAGVYAQNAGAVGLRNVDLKDNAVGIEVDDVQWLALWRTRVTGSEGYGLDARDTERIEIASSLFEGNGAASDSSLRVVAGVPGQSTFAVATSTIISPSGDAIRLITEPAASGSTIQVALTNNIITTHGTGAAGVRATWDGAFAAAVSGNEFKGTGASSAGVLADLASATAATSLVFSNNKFTLEGANSTGVDITAAGAATLGLSGNLIGFAGTGGTGLAFSLGDGSDVQLTSNGIGDAAGGATGILFRSMTGESHVTLNDNLVNLVGSSVLVDRGIIFSSITGKVHLAGTQDNRVNFASQPFFAPAGKTEGQFLLNDELVP